MEQSVSSDLVMNRRTFCAAFTAMITSVEAFADALRLASEQTRISPELLVYLKATAHEWEADVKAIQAEGRETRS